VATVNLGLPVILFGGLVAFIGIVTMEFETLGWGAMIVVLGSLIALLYLL
jgi:hypothetical protein